MPFTAMTLEAPREHVLPGPYFLAKAMTASKFELINSSLKMLSDLTWSTVILQLCTSLFIEPFGFAKGTEVGRKVLSLAEPQESSVENRPPASQPNTEAGEQTGVKTVTVIKDDNRHHRQEDLFLIKLSFTSWEKCCRAKSRRTKWAGRENSKRKITTGMRSLAPRRTSQCNGSGWKGGLEWELYLPLGISAAQLVASYSLSFASAPKPRGCVHKSSRESSWTLILPGFKGGAKTHMRHTGRMHQEGKPEAWAAGWARGPEPAQASLGPEQAACGAGRFVCNPRLPPLQPLLCPPHAPGPHRLHAVSLGGSPLPKQEPKSRGRSPSLSERILWSCISPRTWSSVSKFFWSTELCETLLCRHSSV